MAKKVILWTAPRCLSNAFLCSISTLKSTKYFHEVFSGPHYFKLKSQRRYCEDLNEDDLTYDGAKKILLADYPGMNLIFSKELAISLPEEMWHEIISGNFVDFTHSFLIRDPKRAIYSFYKGMSHGDKDPLLDPSEIKLFYPKLYKLYNFIKEKTGRNPVVIDAIDLQTNPDEAMKNYCDAVGIQFDPKMTSWKPGSFVPRYKFWVSGIWHSTVNQSNGFIKINPGEQKPVSITELPQEIQQYIEDSRFYYEELQKACLKHK